MKGQRRATERLLLAIALVVSAVVGGIVAISAQVTPTSEDDLPPEKAALLAQEEADRQYGLQNPAPVPPNPEAAGPPFKPDPFPEGIFGEDEAEFPPGLGYEFTNIWRKAIAGKNVIVYAGGRIDPPSQAVILVMISDPRTGGKQFEVYLPSLVGPVRIETEAGQTLTLVSEPTGDRFTFDMASRRCQPQACPRQTP